MATQEFCKTKEELTEKYFGGFPAYNIGNMAIISLLSDVQEIISQTDHSQKEHYRQLLNDIKCVLSTQARKEVEVKE